MPQEEGVGFCTGINIFSIGIIFVKIKMNKNKIKIISAIRGAEGQFQGNRRDNGRISV